MPCIPTLPLRLALPLGLVLCSSAAGAQDPAGAGVEREAMWPAPTRADWQRPCLITWQRTFGDALEVARETGRPILVCVNMDGEIASEHYAGVRYRQPEIAALYEPYVTVIASVYRHNPRDYDEGGRRIPCPRFGSVTCGEHIAIEPGLYERFFEGQRVAPRHIAVELDGSESYDVFYAWDTDSVFTAIREGVADRPIDPSAIARGDRTLVERVASRDVRDRAVVETAYLQGDRVQRRTLLQAALRFNEVSQADLLRLALFGQDLELRQLAWRVLLDSPPQGALELVADLLDLPLEAAERDALIDLLRPLADSSPRARTLVSVHRGLAERSSAVDLASWSRALAEAEPGEGGREQVALEYRVGTSAERARARPGDGVAQLELAEASLVLAVDPSTARALAADPRSAETYQRFMFQDALRAAMLAEELGTRGWRVDAAVGVASWYLGDYERAYERAQAAIEELPAGEVSWSAMAVLGVFGEARRDMIAKAVRAKEEWPAQWLTDVHAAYGALARHPLGSDAHVAIHYDFVKALGAKGEAARVLDEGLQRYPDSSPLHERLRGRVLEDRGLRGFDGLEAVYEEMLRAAQQRGEASLANLEWFAGYASLVVAEFHRRAGDEAQALAAYGRAIAHYERVIAADPESRVSADHYVAVAIAGRARLAYEGGDDERALSELLASFEREPDAASTLDGLGLSAVGTARMVIARLTEEARGDLAARLQEALDELDPRHLALPAFERGGPPPPERRGARRRPGGRSGR